MSINDIRYEKNNKKIQFADKRIFSYFCRGIYDKIMNNVNIEENNFPYCPIRNILARISNKWALLVIYTLNNTESGILRFNELQHKIPDISQRMLTVTLRTLEEDGYLIRTVYAEVPPRVEYMLTDRTKTLLPHINALIEWALDNKDSILKDRKANSKK